MLYLNRIGDDKEYFQNLVFDENPIQIEASKL